MSVGAHLCTSSRAVCVITEYFLHGNMVEILCLECSTPHNHIYRIEDVFAWISWKTGHYPRKAREKYSGQPASSTVVADVVVKMESGSCQTIPTSWS